MTRNKRIQPLLRSTVNTNEAIYSPEEDLYNIRYTLPEVTVTGDKSKRVHHSHSPRTSRMSKNQYKLQTGDLLGAMTTGMNVLSPSQWWGAIRDAEDLQDGFNKLMRGNSGFVTQNYEQEHPYISTAINLAGDAAALGVLSGIKTPKSVTYNSSPKTEKMVVWKPNTTLALPLKSELPPEATYTGKIPRRTLDLTTTRQRNDATSLLKDAAKNPNDYLFQEIDDALKVANINKGTVPIKLKSKDQIIELGGQSFRDHLKHNINPVLRHDGLKGVPLDATPEEAMQYVREKYSELNTFSRGIADPRDLRQEGLYKNTKANLAKKIGREPSDEEIMDYIAITPNRGTTGHGTIGRNHGEYTLYTSNGLDQSAGYALRGDRPTMVNQSRRAVYELQLPEQIPTKETIDNRFSPIANYILNNRFAFPQRQGVVRELKDLYSEYRLPYQLYNGKALNANVDYNKGYQDFLRSHGISNKEEIISGVMTYNNNSRDFKNLMQQIGSDIDLPYLSIKTALKRPDKFFKQRSLYNNYIRPLVREYKTAQNECPEHMESLLNKEFLKDVKFALKRFKTDYKHVNKLRPAISQLTEEQLISEVRKTIGDIPPGGFLKHKNAHNVFGTEGRNKALTVNDTRYMTPTKTTDTDATLQHYVFYNKTGDPILKIKRRVPFNEWAYLKNHGSSHYGSYSPGQSRRMSSILPPILLTGAAYNYYNQ